MQNKQLTLKHIFLIMAAFSGAINSGVAKENTGALNVTAAIPESFPPYYHIDSNGKPYGFAIDIMDALAKKSNINIAYQVKESWHDVFQAAKLNEADLIPNVGATKSRSSYLLFTQPVDTFQISLFIRSESSNEITSIEDLSSRKIAAVKSNVGYKIASKIKTITTVPYDSFEQAIFALFAGHVEAVAYPKAVGWKFLNDAKHIHDIQVIKKPLKEIRRVIGVSKNNQVLFSRLNEQIKTFVTTKKYRKIYNKWFATSPSYWNADRIILFFSLLLFSLLLLFFLWRHHSVSKARQQLDKLVKLRTQELNIKINSLEKARQDLDYREYLLQSNLTNTPLAAITWDKNFNCTQWNKSAERIFGYSKEEAVGKSALDLIVPKEIHHLIGDIFETLLSKNGGGHSTNENITKDGKTILCEWFNSPITDKEGKLVAVTSMAQNISKQEQNKNELIRTQLMLQAILNAIPVSVYWKNTQNIYAGCNEAFAKDVGLTSADEIIGRNDFDLNWEGLATTAIEDDSYVMSHNLMHINKIIPQVNSEGVMKWLESSKIPLTKPDGSVYGILGVYQDISDRKESELELMYAKIEAQNANKAKSIFLTNMSHELRTPLHGILSFSDFGMERTENDTSDKLYKYFSQIHNSGERLLILLNNLLDISKLEAGKMEMELAPCSLRDIIKTVINEQLVRIQESDMSIDYDCGMKDIKATLDKGRITQVIANLLSNAIKFNQQGQPIHISVQQDQLDGIDAIYFSIRDHGTGIPEKEISLVFDKFFQSSMTTSGTAGTGLGLPISQEIIEAHKGKIWAENHPDGGSIFKLLLPLKH